MDFIFVGGCVVALFVGVYLLMRADRVMSRNERMPFQKKKLLCSQQERRFLGALIIAVGGEYIIFSKVRLADLLTIDSGLKGADRVRAYELVAKDNVDFVLCNKTNTEIVCAVELFDREKESNTMKQRARHMDKLFKKVGVPFARFPISEKYPSRIIEEQIKRVIQRQSTQEVQESTWEYVNKAG